MHTIAIDITYMQSQQETQRSFRIPAMLYYERGRDLR